MSYQQTLTDAIKVTLGTLVMDPVTGRVMRGEEVLRLTLLRAADDGSEEAGELLDILEQSIERRRKRLTRRKSANR